MSKSRIDVDDAGEAEHDEASIDADADDNADADDDDDDDDDGPGDDKENVMVASRQSDSHSNSGAESMYVGLCPIVFGWNGPSRCGDAHSLRVQALLCRPGFWQL